jgi:hypothetical protein
MIQVQTNLICLIHALRSYIFLKMAVIVWFLQTDHNPLYILLYAYNTEICIAFIQIL